MDVHLYDLLLQMFALHATILVTKCEVQINLIDYLKVAKSYLGTHHYSKLSVLCVAKCCSITYFYLTIVLIIKVTCFLYS